MPAVLAVLGTTLLCEPGHAFSVHGVPQGPWCAGYSIGWSWQENCTLPSLDYCRSQVIAGNRGICFPNPSWAGYADAPRKRHTKGKRR